MGAQQNLRIFIDAHYFDGAPQGVTTYIYNIYKAMIDLELPVELIFGACSLKIFDDYPELKGRVEFIKYRFSNKLMRLMFEIPSIVRSGAYDFAHFQYILPPFLGSTRSIVTIHDVLFFEDKVSYPLSFRLSRGFLFKNAARRSDIVATVSEFSRDQISRVFNIVKQNIVLTPCAAKVKEEIAKRESKEEVRVVLGFDKYILYVSRVEPRKNHVALLRAFVDGGYWRQGYKLVLVGDKSIRVKALDDYVRTLPSSANEAIIWLSDLSVDFLNHLYNAADIFVYPSLSEGFGIPPLEAALFKTPVICSNLTAMSEYDFFGDNHINVRDQELLSARISAGIQQRISEKTLGDIRDLILRRYSWELAATNLYTSIKKTVVAE